MTGQVILIHKIHLLTKLKNHQGALKATWPRGVQKFVPLAPDGQGSEDQYLQGFTLVRGTMYWQQSKRKRVFPHDSSKINTYCCIFAEFQYTIFSMNSVNLLYVKLSLTSCQNIILVQHRVPFIFPSSPRYRWICDRTKGCTGIIL